MAWQQPYHACRCRSRDHQQQTPAARQQPPPLPHQPKGIQRHISDLAAEEPWADTWQEVEVNVGGVVHLTRLFLPHLRAAGTAGRPAVLAVVTSGLSFVPKVRC